MGALLGLLAGCAPEAPPAAEDCGACHTEAHAAWSRSAHAEGGTEVFDAWLPEVRRAWGPAAAGRCVACHRPGFGADEAVGCVACHAAVGNRGPADGALVVDAGAPLAGPTSPPGAPHDVVRRTFLEASDLCVTCHQVEGPGLLVERTGEEHAESGASETCADCHLDGHALAVESLLPGALALRAVPVGDARVRLEVENLAGGHRIPTGAAFLRDLALEVDGEVVLDLGPRPARGGVPVPLLTDADGLLGEGLAPGEVRAVTVPAGGVATLWYGRLRPEAADALGVAAPPRTRVAEVAF